MNNAAGSAFIIRILGHIANNIGNPVDQGSRNQLLASVAEGINSREYYTPVGIEGTANDFSKNEILAKELWDWTEKELQRYTA
jgi:retinol dehydrogenase 12